MLWRWLSERDIMREKSDVRTIKLLIAKDAKFGKELKFSDKRQWLFYDSTAAFAFKPCT